MINAGTVGAYLTLDISDFRDNLSFAESLIQKFRNNNGDTDDSGGSGNSFLDGFADSLFAAGKNAVKFAGDTARSVCDAFGDVPEKTRLYILHSCDGMNSVLNSAAPILSASAAGCAGGILSAVDNSLGASSGSGGMFGAGGRAVLALARGMQGRKLAAADSMSGIMRSILSAADSVSFSGVGSNIVSGIIRGMNLNKPALVSAAAALAQSAAAAAKRALGINSPSRVMMDVGRFAAEGMELGLRKGSRNVYAAASQISRETAEALGGISSPALNYSASRSSDYNERIDRLDKILDAVEKLADSQTTMEIDGRPFGRLVREALR